MIGLPRPRRKFLRKKTVVGLEQRAPRLALLPVEHRAEVLLLPVAELEVLRALDGLHVLLLALGALELQGDLLRGLRLLAEDRLGLTAETLLLRVVAALSLRDERSLPRLVLSNLLRRMLVALLAVRIPLLG